MIDTLLKTLAIYIKEATCLLVSLDLVIVKPLTDLHMTYCMHMYGCELWNLNENGGNQFKVAWKKIKRRIWEIPPRTHNNLVCNITNNIDAIIDKRIIRFIYNSINHGNKTNILRIKLLFVTIHFLQIINIYQISMA